MLKALGADAAARRMILLLPAAAVIVASGLLAVAIAALTSPLVRLGLTSDVDPDLNFFVTPWVLAGGLAAIIAMLAAAVASSIWRVGRATQGANAPRRVPAAPALGAALRPLVGGGERRAAAAARAAVVGAVVGVGGIVAVVTVASSLAGVGDDPRVHGWSFDAAVSSQDPDLRAVKESIAFIEHDPAVDRVVWASVSAVEAESERFEVFGLDGAGSLHPTLLTGRAPEAKDEIALGAKLFRDVGARLGQRLRVTTASGARTLRVVGTAVYPGLGSNGDPDTTASMTLEGFGDLGAESYQTIALLDLAEDANSAPLAARVTEAGREYIEPFAAPKIENLDSVGALPSLLIAFLTLLVVAAVGHSLIVSVGARRREFAILRSLGFLTSQTRAAVFWQATVTVLGGLIGGVFIGAIVGRQAWRIVADNVGILNRPTIPIGVVLGLVGATFVLANLLAILPARRAVRLRTAAILRTE